MKDIVGISRELLLSFSAQLPVKRCIDGLVRSC